MTKVLTGVLSVIAAGVLLVAYGLLVPRATPIDQRFDARTPGFAVARPTFASDQVIWRDNPYVVGADGRPMTPAYPVPVSTTYGVPSYMEPQEVEQVRPVRRVSAGLAPRRQAVRYVPGKPRRNWKKAALVIGGSSATGAGLGAIFGGKKGALIGAAIAGGASTIFETTKDR